MTGFMINEVMTGTHSFVFGDDLSPKPLNFNVNWGHEDVLMYLNPKNEDFLVAGLAGKITVDGLCEDADCSGSLELDYFGEHKITYQLEFLGRDKKRYMLEGTKLNIKPWNILTSHTTCFVTITDNTGVLRSRGVVYFKWSTLLSFLTSFRLVKP